MNVPDLLDPEKMNALNKRFSPITEQEIDEVKRKLVAKGLQLRPFMPYVPRGVASKGDMFKRSNFGKK